MTDVRKPLNNNDNYRAGYRPVPGWSLLLFAAALIVLWFASARLLPDLGMLPLLAVFFAAGLLAVALAVLPLGWAALPAMGVRPAGWRPVLFGTLATLGLSLAVSSLGIEVEGMKQVFSGIRGPKQIAYSLLLLAVLAPLVEELIFRGLIYGWLAGRWGTTVAWIGSTLTFAGAHIEPAHIALVLPLAILFGWLRRRTDSLLPSLVAHIANNAMAVGAAVLFEGMG